MTGPDPAANSDWSEPKIYGSPMPVPGDASSLAVAVAQSDEADRAGEDGQFSDFGHHLPDSPWSSPTYHGPRRFRPRGDGDEPAGAATVDGGVAAADASGAELAGEPTDEPGGGHPGEQPADEAPAPSLLASSRTMAIASLASRATGFLRTMAIGAALGSGVDGIADAYNLGNTLPNMVYELLLGGVLTSVIIPVLVKAQQDDRDRGVAYTQRLLSLAVVGLAVTTLLAVLAAPLLIDLYQGDAPFHSLATLWATLLLPEIFFYGVGAMLSAILNTRHVYGWPAWAPVANNLITIAAALLYRLVPGPSHLSAGTISNTQILVIGIGTTLGIVAQALILFLPLRRIGFRWRWRFRAAPNEAGRMAEFRTLTLWVLGYVAVSQIGVYVINRVASGQRTGITIFANADLLFQVPYGIVGVSLLTALMPRMSRAAARGDNEDVLDDLRLGTRLSAVALVPIAAGLIVLGPAFTSVILLGRFDVSQARLVGIALAAGAFGLLPFALVMLQQRVFYAMRDARTPALINLAMVGTKVVLVLLASTMLHGRSIIIALTVSTSLSYIAGCTAGHLLLRRRFGRLGFSPVVRMVALIAAASLAGAAVALGVVELVNAVLGVGRVSGLVQLVGGGVLGLVTMAAIAVRLPIPEVAQLASVVRGRLGRKPDVPVG
ncbi:murein biosynthesis integral membrane protein MurJ [Jatrophihabitans telluris]|uniref:Murein biosynthesis integral membrane protein MurJ n=1 Tax=Jatrophihabitans telluris TaxID=2038343 RepID=A0ABY4QYG4_9ACTN|nr:murein biosynthesis integral membrane protein MurJ [Jatrophihabitans telluris]UQX88540.1 murein biosynthesis integral membrane protein MurJ [Jatrophihabitans telluris]